MQTIDQTPQSTPPCEDKICLGDTQSPTQSAAKGVEIPAASTKGDWGVKCAFKSALRRYCKFDGRASRPEFWYLALGNFIIIMCINVLMTILTVTCAYAYTGVILAQLFSNLLIFVYSGFMFMPGLSLCVRRLHDSGKDWKLLLLALIPLAGPFIVAYFLCLPSDSANQYGESPAAPAGEDEEMPPFVAAVVEKVEAFVGIVCRAPGKWAGILGGGFALLLGLILLIGHFFSKPTPSFKLGDSSSFGESKSSFFNFFGNDLDEAVEMLQRCEIINPFDVGKMRKNFYTGDLEHDNLAGDSSRDFLYNYKMFKDGHRKLSEHDYILDIYLCWDNDRKKHLPLEAVEVFIEEGSALNGTRRNLYALDLAASAGHTEIVELMLEEGADASLGIPLALAAAGGHVETVKVLLQAKGIDVNAKLLGVSYTALEEAVDKGHTEVVKLLVAAPGIKVTPRALHTAVLKRYQEIVKLLLAVPNVDVNMLYGIARDDDSILGASLNVCYEQIDVEIVKMLLAVPNIDVNIGTGHPIIRAERRDQHEIVSMLLAHPGIKVPAEFVHKTIEDGNMERLKTFMAVPGFDINESSPLVKAVSSKKVEVIKWLLSTPGIDVNRGCPLAEAVRMRSLEFVKLLTEAPGIKVPATVLCEAVEARNVEILKLLLTVPDIDINGIQQEDQGKSVLGCAFDSHKREGDIEIVKLLLAVPGIDANDFLYKAVISGRGDILKLLLDAPGIDIFRGYEKGWTAMDAASNDPVLCEMIREAIEKLPPNASKYTEAYHYMKLVRAYAEHLQKLQHKTAIYFSGVDYALGTAAKALLEQQQQYQNFSFTHVGDIASFLNEKDKGVFKDIECDESRIEQFLSREKGLSKRTYGWLSQLCYGTAAEAQSADSPESIQQDTGDNVQQSEQESVTDTPQVVESTVSDDRSSLDPLIQRMRDLRCRQSDSKLYQKRLLTLLPKIREGADVNLTLPETKGNTALHYSCAIGSLSITQWLLEHGANPNAVTNKGKTPLQCVGSDNREAIIKLLKEYQAR